MPLPRSRFRWVDDLLNYHLNRLGPLGPWVRFVQDSWRKGKYRFYRDLWRNPKARQHFLKDPPRLSSVQRRILSELENRGVSFCRFEELFPNQKALWEELSFRLEEFVVSPKVHEAKAHYLSTYDKAFLKEYIVQKYEAGQRVSLKDPWLRFGLESPVLDVVNAYLELCSKLNSFNVWYTIPLELKRHDIGSQRWHRDPEDMKMIKVFLYFSEVAAESGPLQMIPESLPGGKYQHLWPCTSEIGTVGYPPPPIQERINRQIPDSEIVTCTGPPGTFVFCNTTALHRGGHAKRGARHLAFWAYVSPATLWKPHFRIVGNRSDSGLTVSGRLALP